jgi:hypothetical protein
MAPTHAFPSGVSPAIPTGTFVRISLSADGASAVAKPTEKVQFSVPSGDHAGAYALDNVNVRAIAYPDAIPCPRATSRSPAPTERRAYTSSPDRHPHRGFRFRRRKG